MPLHSGPTVAETFGFNLLLFGQVVVASLNRQLSNEAPNDQVEHPTQTVIFSPSAGGGAQPESQGWQSNGSGSWTGADIDLAERGESLAKLRLRMTGTGGNTVEHFPSEDPSLGGLLARCGGQNAFDKAVLDTCTRIQKLDGALMWNWFHVGFDAKGKLGTICYTCNNHSAFSIGSTHGNPFGSFIQHCQRSGAHKDARRKAQQDADALMATPHVEGLSR